LRQASASASDAAPPAVPVHITRSAKRVPIRFDIVGQTEGSKQVGARGLAS
jgi:hypothetical protein